MCRGLYDWWFDVNVFVCVCVYVCVCVCMFVLLSSLLSTRNKMRSINIGILAIRTNGGTTWRFLDTFFFCYVSFFSTVNFLVYFAAINRCWEGSFFGQLHLEFMPNMIRKAFLFFYKGNVEQSCKIYILKIFKFYIYKDIHTQNSIWKWTLTSHGG